MGCATYVARPGDASVAFPDPVLSPHRVLDLSDERGQFASMLLAQLGADVYSDTTTSTSRR